MSSPSGPKVIGKPLGDTRLLKTNPWLKPCRLMLPSWVKPKPRTWSPRKPVPLVNRPRRTRSGRPNMPIFWYWLRRCGAFSGVRPPSKRLSGESNWVKPELPKKPGRATPSSAFPAGSSVWQSLQLLKVNMVIGLKN